MHTRKLPFSANDKTEIVAFHYRDLAEWTAKARELDTLPRVWKSHDRRNLRVTTKPNAFNNNSGYAEALQRIASPRAEVIEQVKKAMQAPPPLGAGMVAELVKHQQGARPVVSAYLAGQPKAMRRRKQRVNHDKPLAVIYHMNASADVPAEDVRKYGVACAAAALSCAVARPVQLYLAHLNNSFDSPTVTYVPMPLTSGAMAQAAAILGEVSTMRCLSFSVKFYDGACHFQGGKADIDLPYYKPLDHKGWSAFHARALCVGDAYTFPQLFSGLGAAVPVDKLASDLMTTVVNEVNNAAS